MFCFFVIEYINCMTYNVILTSVALYVFFFAFEGVALLPFVDERRLRAALADVYPDLTPEEGEKIPTI